ncbi:choice-of-anchor D domain-containing protein [Dactylosporangium darangshiense]|uniref:Choice-of-anchor D domain-containing protein n=1 Tax=Dactylosporangium darangshiense TaxID=579108 RepID=A0ABP8DVU1_9ACTN
MRLLRKFGVLLGTVALAVTALPAVANAAGPTAPYDAFTIGGRWNSSLDPSNATFGLHRYNPIDGFDAFWFGADQSGQHSFQVSMSAPAGQTFGIGSFPTTLRGDATHYAMAVSDFAVQCTDSTGLLTVYALTRDPATQDVTSFAASYYEACHGSSGESESYGEIRWHSDKAYVGGAQSPNYLNFDTVDLGHSSQVQTVTITSTGSSALELGAASIGGAMPAAYTISANTCTGTMLVYGQSCTISVKGQSVAAGAQPAFLQVLDNTTFGKRQIGLGMTGHLGAEGTYRPMDPVRLLDTREGNGAPKAPLGGGQTLHLQVTGRGGVPSSKISAVVLNVTVTAPTSAGYLTVYPAGVTRPTASSLNFPAGWTGANSVTVPVGTNGQVDIFNAAGNVHVIADVLGYYNAYDDTHPQVQASGGQYYPTQPVRLLDSRDPAFGGPLAPFEYVRIPFNYTSKDNFKIQALAVNITAVNPTMGGYVTAWNGVGSPPTASTLNFTKGSVVPNFAIVPTTWCSECGGYMSIGVANLSGGSTHIVVDIFGFYDDGQPTLEIPNGLRFHPLTPTRIVDTRDGLGASTFTGAGTKTVAAPATVAGDNTYALVSNVTGVDPANSTYLSLWATGKSQPTVSNLNLTPHEVRPNAAFVNVGPGNKFNMFNAAWKVDVVIDVSGTFELEPGTATSAQSSSLDRPGPLQISTAGTPQRLTLR